jgi:hypothetical protein
MPLANLGENELFDSPPFVVSPQIERKVKSLLTILSVHQVNQVKHMNIYHVGHYHSGTKMLINFNRYIVGPRGCSNNINKLTIL